MKPITSEFVPLVSIIIPNYNHAKFLRKRLDSIYLQSYPHFEVILLDDNSTDESRAILEEYFKKYSSNTRYFPNEINSGGVFFQWKKAFELAQGELVWIAESDDYADLNFLEKLVPFFNDSAISLAYCYSKFINQNEDPIDYSFDIHTESLNKEKWKKNFINTAANEVEEALSIKNSIPNVSSVLMRNKKLKIFSDKKWLEMKICGDWILYLEMIRGGKLAFSRETVNYFRFHQSNSSAKTYKTFSYINEHKIVLEYIIKNYKISESKILKFSEELESFWNFNIADTTIQKFKDIFTIDNILSLKEARKPNLLIGLISFVYGGGEIYPIRLANEMYKRGYAVTLFNYNIFPTETDVRSLVHPNIPIINWDNSDINKLLSDYKIEVINTHYEGVDRVFSKRSNIEQIKQVVTMHGMYEILYNSSYHEFNQASTYFLGVNHWIYTAKKNLKPFEKNHLYDEQRFTQIDNGFTPIITNSITRTDLGLSETDIVICLVSRAINEKGWLTAIQAIENAQKQLTNNLHLLLIGEGPSFDDLNQTKLSPNIHLLGFRKNTIDYYNISDIGILPSSFSGESFPLCLIECLFAEKPVIATNIGEIPYMLTREDRKAGILIPSDCNEIMVIQLTDAILALINDKKLYQELKNNALYCAERFGFSIIGDKYEEVFNHTIKNQKLHLAKYYQLYYQLSIFQNMVQVFFDTGKGFSGEELLQCTHSNNQEQFHFDLSFVKGIKHLRLDPAAIPVRVKFISAKIILSDRSCKELSISSTNANNHDGNYLNFYHDDPIIIFELPTLEAPIQEFIVNFTLIPFSYKELYQSLVDLNNKLSSINFNNCCPSNFEDSLEIFYNTGNGFNANESIRCKYDPNRYIYNFNLSDIHEIKGLRWDPASVPIRIELISAELVYTNNTRQELSVESTNANNNEGGRYLDFDHNDPIIIFKLPDNELIIQTLIIHFIATPFSFFHIFNKLSEFNSSLLLNSFSKSEKESKSKSKIFIRKIKNLLLS